MGYGHGGLTSRNEHRQLIPALSGRTVSLGSPVSLTATESATTLWPPAASVVRPFFFSEAESLGGPLTIRDLSLKLFDHPCQFGTWAPLVSRPKIGERLIHRTQSFRIQVIAEIGLHGGLAFAGHFTENAHHFCRRNGGR